MTSRGALVLAVLILLALAWWSWRQLEPAPNPPPEPTATATLGDAGLPTPTPLTAPPGYRLAGVALGEPDSFAVVEAPGGSNVLYRLNADVPGLGRLVRIEAERIVISTAGGEFDLWLTPAATPTPSRTVVTRASTPSRLRTPAPGRSTRRSASSDAPDRQAF